MLLLIMTRQIYSINTYFRSVFSKDSSELSDHTHLSHSPNHIENIEISKEEVFVTLAGLDPNKAMGIDNINAKVSKHCALVLVQPIPVTSHFCKTGKPT